MNLIIRGYVSDDRIEQNQTREWNNAALVMSQLKVRPEAGSTLRLCF